MNDYNYLIFFSGYVFGMTIAGIIIIVMKYYELKHMNKNDTKR